MPRHEIALSLNPAVGSCTVSVDDSGSIRIEDGTFAENVVRLDAKEARALLRALRKFEADGLLEED